MWQQNSFRALVKIQKYTPKNETKHLMNFIYILNK